MLLSHIAIDILDLGHLQRSSYWRFLIKHQTMNQGHLNVLLILEYWWLLDGGSTNLLHRTLLNHVLRGIVRYVCLILQILLIWIVGDIVVLEIFTSVYTVSMGFVAFDLIFLAVGRVLEIYRVETKWPVRLVSCGISPSMEDLSAPRVLQLFKIWYAQPSSIWAETVILCLEIVRILSIVSIVKLDYAIKLLWAVGWSRCQPELSIIVYLYLRLTLICVQIGYNLSSLILFWLFNVDL